MITDRHIYVTTGVLALAIATAINVLTPRGPFAGRAAHRDPGVATRAAQASPAAIGVSVRAKQAPQRGDASL
jgi:hypothetical protein